MKWAVVLLNSLIGSIFASSSRYICHASPLAYLIKNAQADVIRLIVRENPRQPVLLLELLLLVVIVLLDLPRLLGAEVSQHAVQLLVTTDVLQDRGVLMSQKVRIQVGLRWRLSRQFFRAASKQAIRLSYIHNRGFLFI